MTLSLFPRARQEVAPGAVHVPDWLSVDEQRHLVERWREWTRTPGPAHHTRLPRGGVMSVETVCLGWHWMPYRYSRFVEDGDGAPVTPFPDWLGFLARRAVAEAWGDEQAAAYEPDVALANFYDGKARMGMHRDKDELSAAPVVSLSVGNACLFRFGTGDRNGPSTDVDLRSGDLFVFGGPARFAYHGVPKTWAGTADPACGLETGRLNVTVRATGRP